MIPLDGRRIWTGWGDAVVLYEDFSDYYQTEMHDIVTPLYPSLMAEIPWLFDFDEPWKAPVHYPPAPRTIPGRSAQMRNRRIIYKQPRARMGFKRGQRR